MSFDKKSVTNRTLKRISMEPNNSVPTVDQKHGVNYGHSWSETNHKGLIYVACNYSSTLEALISGSYSKGGPHHSLIWLGNYELLSHNSRKQSMILEFWCNDPRDNLQPGAVLPVAKADPKNAESCCHSPSPLHHIGHIGFAVCSVDPATKLKLPRQKLSFQWGQPLHPKAALC